MLVKVTQSISLKALKIFQNIGTLRAMLTLFPGWGWGNYILKICFYIGVSFEKMINFPLTTYGSK